MFKITQEVLYYLSLFLDGQSLIELTNVSRYFNHIFQDEKIWKKRCSEEFGITENKWDDYSWRTVYYNSIYAHLCVLKENNSNWFNTNYTTEKNIPRPLSENTPPSCWIDIAAAADNIYALDNNKKLWIWEPQKHSTQPFRQLEQDGSNFTKISSYFENCIGLTEDNKLYSISELGVDMIYDGLLSQPKQIVSHPIYSVILTSEGRMCFIGNKKMGLRSMEKYFCKMLQQRFFKSSFFLCEKILEEDPISQLGSLDLYVLALTKSGCLWILDISNLEEFSKNPKKHMVELTKFSGGSKRSLYSNCDQFAICTEDGQVLMGDSEVEQDTNPVKLSFLQNVSVRSVSFGCAFPSCYQQQLGRTFGALTKDGKVISWRSIRGRLKVNGDEDVELISLDSLGFGHALNIAFGTEDSGSKNFSGNCFVALVVNKQNTLAESIAGLS